MARPNSSDGKTGATLAKMCRACGSGQPPADPYEEAGGTRLRVGGTRAGGSHRRCSTPDDFVGAVENLCKFRAIIARDTFELAGPEPESDGIQSSG